MRSVIALLFLLVALALPAGADAAPPSREFFGVMVDGPLIEPIGLDVMGEARLMRRSGVGSARLVLYWDDIEPTPGQFDWTRYDLLVAALARQRIRVFPVLYRAPHWAREGDEWNVASPPRLEEWSRFVDAAVRRYGRGGTFWQANRGLPRREIHEWQIWNEPNLEKYWAAPPWGLTYTNLLRAAHGPIKAVDPRAKVVAAGLTGPVGVLTEALYLSRAQQYFDAVGIHAYRTTARDVYAALADVRGVIREYKDDAKIVASEVSFSSGLGRSSVNYGIEHTERGQRKILEQLFSRLIKGRKRLGLSSVHWYTWMSWPPGREVSFDYSGLRKLTPTGKVVSKPALTGLRRSIAAARRRGR